MNFFLRMLLVVVIRSPSDNSAIRYVLPVLCMTSHFHVLGHIYFALARDAKYCDEP